MGNKATDAEPATAEQPTTDRAGQCARHKAKHHYKRIGRDNAQGRKIHKVAMRQENPNQTQMPHSEGGRNKARGFGREAPDTDALHAAGRPWHGGPGAEALEGYQIKVGGHGRGR